ncbi:MAG: hypothetical protein CMA60_00265 [Euryarchaeota archaeon]|nr:hypothetical protein [Euryarchaeota archaeon]|tara:strand:+ start:5636 stop:6052 length:417 start_codon:yes stop_codon:yes gene_type:complete
MDEKSNGGTAPKTTVARKVKPIKLEVTNQDGNKKLYRLHYHEDARLPCVQARNNGALGFIGGDESKPIMHRTLVHVPEATQLATVNVDGSDEDVRVFVFQCKHCAYHRGYPNGFRGSLHFIPSTDLETEVLLRNDGKF